MANSKIGPSSFFATGLLALTVALAACGSSSDTSSPTLDSIATKSPATTSNTNALPEESETTNSTSLTMAITSEAVEYGRLLEEFQCEPKENDSEASVPLAWSDVPAEAASLAITMHHYPNANDTSRSNSYLAIWGLDASVFEIAHDGATSDEWFLGSNKDGTAISYTSPCSPDAAAVHEYTITLYALSATPEELPTQSSVTVDRDSLVAALETVTIIDTATLTFATGPSASTQDS